MAECRFDESLRDMLLDTDWMRKRWEDEEKHLAVVLHELIETLINYHEATCPLCRKNEDEN